MSTAARAGTDHYNTAAITLHWLIALAIVIQVCLGWYMNEVLPDRSAAQAQIVAIHISLGVTIFLLVLLRIAIRIIWPPPPFPPEMPRWERFLAGLSHVVFYLLILILPLTGWTLVSLGDHPIHVWGLPWPHLPGVGAVFGSPAPRSVREELAHIHVFILIWILVVMLVLHVAGALYHQFKRPRVLWRMIPGMRP